MAAFDVDGMAMDKVDELLMANGDGRRFVRVDDGNRLGRGDMGAIGGDVVEFAFEFDAKCDEISLLLRLPPLGL